MEWLCLRLVFCAIVYNHQESTTVYLRARPALRCQKQLFSFSCVNNFEVDQSICKVLWSFWLELKEKDDISQVYLPSLFFPLCSGEVQGPLCPLAVPKMIGYPEARDLHSQQLPRQIGLKSEWECMLGSREIEIVLLRWWKPYSQPSAGLLEGGREWRRFCGDIQCLENQCMLALWRPFGARREHRLFLAAELFLQTKSCTETQYITET